MRSILAAVHHASSKKLPISFLIGRHEQQVGLYCRFPGLLHGLVQGQFHAKYPDCTITLLEEDALDCPVGFETWTMTLHLRPDLFPILRYQQFEDVIHDEVDDPMGGVLQAVAPDHGDLQALFELTVIPASPRRCQQAQAAVERLARPFFRKHRSLARRYAMAASSPKRWQRVLAACLVRFFVGKSEERFGLDEELNKTASRMHDNEKDLQAASVKLGQHLFEVRLRLTVHAPADQKQTAVRKLHEMAAVLHKFTEPRLGLFQSSSISRYERHSHRRGFLLSDEELATMWHLPTSSVRDVSLQSTHSRRLEPPVELPLKKRESGVSELGRVAFQEREERFGMRTEDRFRHLFIVGKTGNGKSTVLQNAILSDMRAGEGLAVVDPHGDLAEAVLASVPSQRTNDVILIDPSDIGYPVGFNPLDVDPAMVDVACDGVVSTFRKVFGTGTHTPRLEDILWNTVLALMLAGDSTILDMLRMFEFDDSFRRQILARIDDPVVRNWWMTTFPKLRSLKGEDPFASVENKLRQLLTNSVIRNMVSQPQSRINFQAAMDSGKIIILNLSKGKLGERTSSFLGSLFVTQLQLATMTRATIPEQERRPFYLYVDEFQNVATSSFSAFLSEARKYKIGLCLATQFLDQVDPETLQAVFGNVGSLLVFAVGPNDATLLAEQLTGHITAADLIALPKYRACVRLMIDGMSRPAFTMETIKLKEIADSNRATIVRAQSRRQYAQPLEAVQTRIQKAFSSAWMMMPDCFDPSSFWVGHHGLAFC
ncbi:AAA-like domain protein [Gimesia algae]|uniref:AAA-like domain protein n=2 Tax=Gimesia algae TaxID=2527971 RepID=A0A517VES1_9PLAN|nr:AAA-like domain protein [Gimesia algae]